MPEDPLFYERIVDAVSWRDIILLTTGTLLAFVAGVIGAWVQRRIDRHASKRPINQVLNFNRGLKLFIIYPHREYVDVERPERPVVSFLPRTSTEDFIAINNVISALVNINWGRHSVRSTLSSEKEEKELTEDDFIFFDRQDLKNNLIVVCSPKSNQLAMLIQQKLVERSSPVFRFEVDKSTGYWCVVDKDEAKYQSESYDQEEKLRRDGIDISDIANQEFDDWAVVTKCTNPWDSRSKVLLVAGIRGIGTWGAAECVKKAWSKIYSKLRRNEKDSDFSALIKIHYQRSDITRIDIQRIEIL